MMTQEELNTFQSNFRQMLQTLECSIYDINGPSNYMPRFAYLEETKQPPSYNTLNKCLNDASYQPSRKTLRKIVAFYNATLTPQITVNQLIHEILLPHRIDSNFMPNIDSRIKGNYYCYYPSDTYHEIHGGYLRIVSNSDGTSLLAQLIMSIHTDEQFNEPFFQYLMKSSSYIAQENRDFIVYRQTLSPKMQSCYYMEGTVKLLQKTALLELVNPNSSKSEHIMYISIPYISTYSHNEFQGGLSSFYSPAVANLQTRFSLIAISRQFFSLKNLALWNYLNVQENDYQRIEVTNEQESDWYRFMMTNGET